MNRSATLSTALAVLCVLSLGVSATTLESSIRTDPDDVIDLDWSGLPVGEGTVMVMKERMTENRGGERTADIPTSVDDRDANGAESVAKRAVSRMKERMPGGGGGTPPADRWTLLELLALLLALLVALAGLALLSTVAAFGYRYAGRSGPRGPSTRGGDAARAWPPDGTATEVDRAWLEMVRRLDLDRPWTRTPAECASAAVESGLDPDAVAEITDAFEEVRYGGAPVTPARRKRVRLGLERLDGEAEGGIA